MLRELQDGSLVYRRPAEQIALISIELTNEQKRGVIKERHDSRTAGHPGVSKTIELITRDFDPWPGLRKDVDRYVKDCETCAKTKHARHKPYGLLMSPAMPNESWSSIAIDFITDLPKSADPLTGTEYDSIMVVVERLTKWAYFIPFLRTAKAVQLAYVFMDKVFATHGMPDEIISDRDKLFTSTFWQSLMDLLGTKHKLSTAYHPQTDGQTERTNQVLEQYLRCYLNYEQTNWVELLPTAQFAYNNSAASTGISPFFANYGKHPKTDRNPKGVKPVADKAQITTTRMTELHELLQQHLQEISTKTTEQANKKRTEGPVLREGGMVYLLRKNIKTRRPSGKLDHTKLGPFRIKKRHGPVTFKLELPASMKIHDVFHKSLLEPAPEKSRQTDEPIRISDESQEAQHDKTEVERIIGHKFVNNVPYYLVHWKESQHEDDTWEPQGKLTTPQVQRYHRDHQTPREARATRRRA
jgi:transposase InsO family protein